MNRLVLLALFIVLSVEVFSQKAQPTTLSEFQKLLTIKSDKILVVNFWATWCAPCIKELPLFEKLTAQNQEAHVLLVSMDYDLDPDVAKVERFIERKKLQSHVLFLKADNPNAWIDKIEKQWSGALPATLVINTQTNKREFVNGEVGEGQLEKMIESVKK